MRSRYFYLSAGLVIGACFVLFWNLGACSYRNGDEARYAESAREMIETGDYLTVRYGGEPFLEKPPAKIWAMALSMRVLGVNEFGARFSSALFATGTMLLGRMLFSPSTGLLGAVILLSSTQFVHEHCGRTAECEPEVVFLYVLSVILFWRMRRDGRWFYPLAASLGCLVMIKGPVVLPLLVALGVFFAFSRMWRVLAPGSAILGILIFAAIVVPWHIHQVLTHGRAFTDMYFGTHILGRFTGNPEVDPGRTIAGLGLERGILYYPKVVFHSMFPWSLLVLPALVFAAITGLRSRQRPEFLLFLWILCFSTAISLSKVKLHWYVVPVLPALAVAIAEICGRLRELESSRWVLFLLTAALLASVLFVPAPEYNSYARPSVRWLRHDTNLVPLWKLDGAHVLSLIPPVLLGMWILGGAGYHWIRSRRQTDRRFGGSLRMVLLGAFLTIGLYHVLLPLKDARHKSDVARHAASVRAAAIRPNRVLLLGREPSRIEFAQPGYYYALQIAGGNRGEILVRHGFPQAAADSTLYRKGTLVLSDASLREWMSNLVMMQQIGLGERMDAFFVKE